jgi:hypothetical protein
MAGWKPWSHVKNPGVSSALVASRCRRGHCHCGMGTKHVPYNYSKLLKIKAILLDLSQGMRHLKV